MTSKRQILVVEDNDINRATLAEILSSDYTVLEAANGQEALAVLEKYKEEISLILLDIVMPAMDGINAIFGVPAGDRLLRGVADMYKGLVGEKGICGRFNADQFACLLERHTDDTDACFVPDGWILAW